MCAEVLPNKVLRIYRRRSLVFFWFFDLLWENSLIFCEDNPTFCSRSFDLLWEGHLIFCEKIIRSSDQLWQIPLISHEKIFRSSMKRSSDILQEDILFFYEKFSYDLLWKDHLIFFKRIIWSSMRRSSALLWKIPYDLILKSSHLWTTVGISSYLQCENPLKILRFSGWRSWYSMNSSSPSDFLWEESLI